MTAIQSIKESRFHQDQAQLSKDTTATTSESLGDSIPRCPVCGRTDYRLSKLYPGTRYCIKCGVEMRPWDYSAGRELFESMARINYAISRMELEGLEGLSSLYATDSPESLETVLYRLFTNAHNAVCKLQGADICLLNSGNFEENCKIARDSIRGEC